MTTKVQANSNGKVYVANGKALIYPETISPDAIDPITLTDAYDIAGTFDATNMANAKALVMSNLSAATSANIVNLNCANAVIAYASTSIGGILVRYLTNLASINFSKLKYIFTRDRFIYAGSSSYINNSFTGDVNLPELIGIISTATTIQFITGLNKAKKIIAPKLKYTTGAMGSICNLSVQWCGDVSYINLSSYCGNLQGIIDYTIILAGCQNLECLILGDVKQINYHILYNEDHTKFSTYVFNTTAVPVLSNASYIVTQTASNMPKFQSGGTGSIYVPDALVNSYKTATNWSTYAEFIKPLSQFNNTWES